MVATVGGAYAVTQPSREQADAQSDAARDAAESAEDIAQQQLDLVQPYVDRGVQAMDAMAMGLGLPSDPSGYRQYDDYLYGGQPDQYQALYDDNWADIQSEYQNLGDDDFRYLSDQGYGLTEAEYTRYIYDTYDKGSTPLPEVAGGNGTSGGSGTSGYGTTGLEGYDPQTAFENSLYYTAADKAHAQDQDRLDNLAGSSGSFFSGANTLAQAQVKEQNYGNYYNNYNNAMASLYGGGQVATQQQSSALSELGSAQQTAAYAEGNADAAFWGGVGQTTGSLTGSLLGYWL